MGVPTYFRVITEAYPDILRFSPPGGCGVYYMDFNGCIHTAARQVLDGSENIDEGMERKIMEAIWEYFEQCVARANPSQMVSICIDGVAPVAKMIQQRKRRFMSIFRHRLAGTSPTWDTNAISPGTPFMMRLQAFLQSRIRGFTRLRIHASMADEPGEGEHKLFAHMATLPADTRVFVYGLDADLIMLSLLSHRKGIFLMREPTHPYSPAACEDGFMYLDIDALRGGILRQMKQQYHWHVPDEAMSDPFSSEANALLEAYLVLCFLMGNDFLPHLCTVQLKKHGLDRVLRAAKETWDFLGTGPVSIQHKRLCTAFFVHLFQRLSEREDEDMWKLNQEYMRKKPFADAKDPFDGYPLEAAHKDPLAAAIFHAGGAKWRALYYKHLLHARIQDSHTMLDACRQFVFGMQWTYLYYKRLPKPAQWFYPYGYGPTLRDLANYLQSTPSVWEDIRDDKDWTTTGFVHPYVQLLCIMPPESAAILPSCLQPFFKDPAYGCAHLFPTAYQVQTYAKSHLWECHPVLPSIDIPCVTRNLRKKKLLP